MISIANFFGIFKLSRYVFEHQFIQPFTSKSSENYRCHLVLNYWFTIGLADPDSGIAFEFDFVVFVASALHVIPPPSLAWPQLWNIVKHSYSMVSIKRTVLLSVLLQKCHYLPIKHTVRCNYFLLEKLKVLHLRTM